MRPCSSLTAVALLVASAYAPRLIADQPVAKKPPTSGPVPSVPHPTSAPASAPHLVIESPTHDFGDVWAGKPLEFTFKISNDGKAPLEIIRVQPTCGCTVAGPSPNRILPGESGMFPFHLDTQKLHGKFQKTINITTNDSAQASLRLTFTGNCKRTVEVTPNDAVFGKLNEQKHQERILTISSRLEKPLSASLVAPLPTSKFHYMLLESVPGKEYKLFVSIDPPFKQGNISESVTLTTNDPDSPTITVNARAIVPARIDVVPPVIYVAKPLPGASTGQPSPRIITINNMGEAPIKVLGATVDDPTVQLKTTEVKPGKLFRVDVTMPQGYKPPDGGRTVLIKTDDAEFREIKVTLKGPVDSTLTKNTTTGPASPRPPRPAMALLGQVAPDFALKTIDGESVGGKEYKSYPATVLDFVAPNCGFCKRQLPLVETIRPTYEARGVRFVNVMQTMHQEFTQDQIVGVLNTVGNKAQLAIDKGNAVGQRFKATSYPTLFVVDNAGKIVEVVVGAKSDIAAVLTKRLDGMLTAEAGGAKPAATQPAKQSAAAVKTRAAP